MRFYCREFSKKNVISLHPHLDPGSLVWVGVCVCMYECIHICMYILLYATHTHTHVPAQLYSRSHTHSHARTHIHTSTQTHKNTHINTHTYTHTPMHTCNRNTWRCCIYIYSESEVTKKGVKSGHIEMTFNAFEDAHEQAKFVFFLVLFLSTYLLHQVNSCVCVCVCVHSYSTGKASERMADCLRIWMLWVLIDWTFSLGLFFF